MQSALAPIATAARERGRPASRCAQIERFCGEARREANRSGACAHEAIFLSTRLAILLWICA
jgi:hypothetical protein